MVTVGWEGKTSVAPFVEWEVKPWSRAVSTMLPCTLKNSFRLETDQARTRGGETGDQSPGPGSPLKVGVGGRHSGDGQRVQLHRGPEILHAGLLVDKRNSQELVTWRRQIAVNSADMPMLND